jgi:hypothetical protein
MSHDRTILKLPFRLLVSLASFLLPVGVVFGQAATRPADPTREHVLVVMTDGLRWEEVFRGADPSLLTKANNDGRPIDELTQRYVRADVQAARAALMPFLWGHLVPAGEIYGNRDKNSDAHVTNGLNFSYPGYSETVVGYADPRVNSNDPTPNPNVTVFEWLNRQPEIAGRTAAFGAWSVIGNVFNRERCGFADNAAYEPLTSIPNTPTLQLLNEWKAETPRVWDDETFDAPTFYTAVEYFKAKRPRLLYLSLGETDDWAHGGNYGNYLDAAHRVDDYLGRLWQMTQEDPEYKGHTTLIFLTDHGRGQGPETWKDHGEKIAESKYIFLAAMGPGVPSNGEIAGGETVTQSQVAATVAALLGKDWNKENPKAAPPLPGLKVGR